MRNRHDASDTHFEPDIARPDDDRTDIAQPDDDRTDIARPDIVVLSPHLDDAVFSIGAWIARAAQNARVEVWTLFTDAPDLEGIAPRWRVFGDYASRKQEDLRALSVLGARPRWHGLRERFWLEPKLSDSAQLFRTPARRALFPNRIAVMSIVESVLDSEARLVAPLGIGHHHDHLEVAGAVIELLERHDAFERVIFYEDVYGLGTLARRRHFVTSREPLPSFRSPEWSHPRLAFALSAAALSEAGPSLDSYFPFAQKWTWTSRVEAVGEFESFKLQAIEAYSSQLAAFSGFERFADFLVRHHRHLGGERLWNARPYEVRD